MAEQPEAVVAEAYLVIEPIWSEWSRDSDGHPILKGAKIARITQTRPNLTRGGVVTKVRFEIEAGVLLPLRPQAVIHLTPGNAETIVVEATDPREDETDG